MYDVNIAEILGQAISKQFPVHLQTGIFHISR